MLRPDITPHRDFRYECRGNDFGCRRIRVQDRNVCYSDFRNQPEKTDCSLLPEFRYEPSTRLVYLSHLGGVDILRPTTGAPVCQLTTNSDTRGGTGLVDVTDGTIYVLRGDGTVHALRHPAQSSTVSHSYVLIRP
jgi:hypothetical protein